MTQPSHKPAGSFTLRLEQIDGYEFRVHFDKEQLEDLVVDEPPPLGEDRGPNPPRLLAAAIASCLSASLVFCLRKAKVEVNGMTAEVDTRLARNEQNRLRIDEIAVRLQPNIAGNAALAGCLDTFEDFCVVTESVRRGVDVHVSVEPVREVSSART